jgi:glycosyltransferase involved in cell wall biosynthesis
MKRTPGRRRHLLLFEPDARGHAAEWIEYLLDWLGRADHEISISVAVPPSLAAEITDSTPVGDMPEVHVVPLGFVETKLCNSTCLPISGFARWWTMRRRLRKTGAECGLFLCLDHLSLPLGLGLKAGGRTISGILFRPSVHYRPGPEEIPPLSERLRDLRKDFLYRLMLRNDAIKTVWSLDPHFPDFAASRYSNGRKVRPIPDPIRQFNSTLSGDGRAVAASPMADQVARHGRTLFLIFGFLTERKGVLTLLDALRRIESRYATAVAVLAAGVIDPRITAPLKAAVEELRETRPEIWLHFDNRRLSSAEIAAYVAEADVILAPYQRFVGSSGVILWAASAGKPVITQEYGLLGRLARDYRLGLAVDTSNASELAAAIITALKKAPHELAEPEGMARFVEGHSPDIFAARLMEDAAGIPARARENAGSYLHR